MLYFRYESAIGEYKAALERLQKTDEPDEQEENGNEKSAPKANPELVNFLSNEVWLQTISSLSLSIF